MKKFKLFLDGNPVQKEVFDSEVGAPVMVDELFDDEPRKAMNERVEILALSAVEWQKLERKIGLLLQCLEHSDNYKKIFQALDTKNLDVSGVHDLWQYLGFGIYRHIDEDNPKFVDEFDEYEYIIYKGEASDDYSAGQNLLDSDFYAVIDERGNWIWGDCYEEVEE